MKRHPDYKFSVTVEYVGPDPIGFFVDGNGNLTPMPPDMAEAMNRQEHDVIYTDGSIAITLYEHCYAMWYLRDGSFGGGSLWCKDWRLRLDEFKSRLNGERR